MVEGVKSRGRLNRTWTEVVEMNMKSLKVNKEDALIESKWRRLIMGTDY